MSQRIFWPAVAALGLGSLLLFLSQSTAQRDRIAPAASGFPGMPGRFVVANASASQVLILDTATGQVYRAKEEDFKKLSDLPQTGHFGGRVPDAPPPVRRPAPDREKDVRPNPPERRPAPKDDAARRPESKDDAPRPDERRPAPKEQPKE